MDKEVWYIYMMEYYSDIKRNVFESVLMRWMNLKPITQSEVSRKETNTVYYCIYICVCVCVCVEFRKMIPMILYIGQQRKHRYKEQTFGLNGRKRGWEDLKE